MRNTFILTLTFIIFSVTGLWAEEISLEQFGDEFFTAIQAEGTDKMNQLLINNPNTAEQFQQALAGTGKDKLAELVGKLRQLITRQQAEEILLEQIQTKFLASIQKAGNEPKTTEEISVKQFETEFFTSMQKRNEPIIVDNVVKTLVKQWQLFVNNPNTAEQFQQKLTRDGKDKWAKFRSTPKGSELSPTSFEN